LRQSFLNGSLTRLSDPDAALRAKIVEFVAKGDFGLGSGLNSDGSYTTILIGGMVSRDDVTFDKDTYLLTKKKAKSLKETAQSEPETLPKPTEQKPVETGGGQTSFGGKTSDKPQTKSLPVQLLIEGLIPAEMWNRLGTKLIPKLKSGTELKVGVKFVVTLDAKQADYTETELKQVLDDLGLTGKVQIERTE
jgi:hypothetical protein